MGYDCSESERKVKQLKSRVPKSSTQNQQLCAQNATEQLFAQALESDNQIFASRHGNRTTSLYDNMASSGYRSRPLPAPYGLDLDTAASDTDPPSSQLSIDDIAAPSRKSAEVEARRLLAKLGNQNAARGVFRSDLHLCTQIERWIGPNTILSKIRAAIQAAIDAIHIDFDASIRHARSLSTRDIGSCKETFLLQVLLNQQRFHHPPTMDSSDDGRPSQSPEDISIREALHGLQKRKSDWSDADYLCGEICSRPRGSHGTHPNSEAELTTSYIKASEGISRVLSDIVLENFEQHDLLFGTSTRPGPIAASILTYPACHLAIRQASPSVLLDLWKRSPIQPWEIDCLRRTPVHVAAYIGCITELSRIFDHDGTTAKDVGQDIFGLTPLLIAACKDDVKAFLLLLKHGADYSAQDNEGRSALALAARNGSHRVVDLILRSGTVPYSCKSELNEAIASGHKAIVRQFITYYNQQPFDVDNTIQIQDGIALAKRKGLNDIAQELSHVRPRTQHSNAAIDSIEALRYEDYLQESAYDTNPLIDADCSFGSLTEQEYSSFEEQYWAGTYDTSSLSFSSSTPLVPPSVGGTSYSYARDSSSWQRRPYRSPNHPD